MGCLTAPQKTACLHEVNHPRSDCEYLGVATPARTALQRRRDRWNLTRFAQNLPTPSTPCATAAVNRLARVQPPRRLVSAAARRTGGRSLAARGLRGLEQEWIRPHCVRP